MLEPGDRRGTFELMSSLSELTDEPVMDMENLYQHEQISQRVYVKAKLLLRANSE